jgi:hypothetical protein
MIDDKLPAEVGSSAMLGPTRDAVLRELDDTTNQTWAGKRKRWAALVRAQDAEIERLRTPLTAQELDKLIEAHVGGAELADGEYCSMVLFAAAVERAHGIGA